MGDLCARSIGEAEKHAAAATIMARRISDDKEEVAVLELLQCPKRTGSMRELVQMTSIVDGVC